MTESGARYVTTPIEVTDTTLGFSSGRRALDDYFARHAVANDVAGIGRAYVLRRGAGDPLELPPILGFYTLSMALAESTQVASVPPWRNGRGCSPPRAHAGGSSRRTTASASNSVATSPIAASRGEGGSDSRSVTSADRSCLCGLAGYFNGNPWLAWIQANPGSTVLRGRQCAISIERLSRITITLTCPGYSS